MAINYKKDEPTDDAITGPALERPLHDEDIDIADDGYEPEPGR